MYSNEHRLLNARQFVSEVGCLAKKYDLPVFVVTEGASLTSNKNCEAVRHARMCHVEWELKNNIDPNHISSAFDF